MGIIILLISISLMIAVGFLLSFLWSMKSGQFDDTYSPSVRMLFEDKPETEIESETESQPEPANDKKK